MCQAQLIPSWSELLVVLTETLWMTSVHFPGTGPVSSYESSLNRGERTYGLWLRSLDVYMQCGVAYKVA